MLLSKLVYLSVKNVLYLADSSFTYEAFLEGDFNNDSDYATNINNVFSPLNQAIARLNDLERIPYKVDSISYRDIVSNVLDYSKLSSSASEIINVVQHYKGEYRNLAFRQFGVNKILITDYFVESSEYPILVEYKQELPYFGITDIQEVELVNGEVLDDNIDLKVAYGISESASNYVMEYVQGRLLEPIAPDLANMHISRAEQYFAGLKANVSMFHQDQVENIYKIGA